MPVSLTSKATTDSADVRIGCSGVQPYAAAATLSPTRPCDGELEGVGQQVLQDLQQPLGVGDDAPRQRGVDTYVELELPAFRLQMEGAADRADDIGEQEIFDIDRHRARFDLGQIEDVGDEVEQIRPGAVNGSRVFDLLRGQVALRVVAKLLTENQDAVEWRAQLVRHVGQELGLVLRGQRELGRLLASSAGSSTRCGRTSLRLDEQIALEIAFGHGVTTLTMPRTCSVRFAAIRSRYLSGPSTCRLPRHLRLATELAFGPHLARHTRHFGREGIELVDHRVDRVLELEDLAADVDVILRDRSPRAPRSSPRRCCAPAW